MQLTASIDLVAQGRLYLIDHFFNTDQADQLLRLAKRTNCWETREQYSHWPGRTVYNGNDPVLEEVAQLCASPELLVQLCQLVGSPISFYGVDLWRDQQGYRIGPHHDYMGDHRFCHLQIYLADYVDPGMGTAFYTDCDPRLSILQIPYRHNSGYFMVTGQDIWHGLPPISRPVDRYSIQIRYTI